MIVTLVYVSVKPEHIDDFIKVTRMNHEHSIQETGNLRFDILQDAAHPDQFVLYEAYESETSAAVHKTCAHYLKWRESVESWMDAPRKGVKYMVLAPESKELW